MSNAVETYLKYAHVQMAAEAFLINPDSGDIVSGTKYLDALTEGNEFNSKFTATLAAEFAANWEVVAHQPNTASGFSAKLFRGIGEDNSGEMVLSFRSTEFIGDAMRDRFVTNRGIHDDGWAFAQIADLRAWWDSSAVQALVGTGGVTVTGYSLGGHLANAFGNPSAVAHSLGRCAANVPLWRLSA